MSKIIVGVDESEGSQDAVTLARALAEITGAAITLVNVFPYDAGPSRTANREFELQLRESSEELLERLRRSTGDDTIDTRAVPRTSPSHGLHDIAESEGAGLVVVGSTHTGRVGRVLPGSNAERLLHGSPCPVAVAPKGYAQRSDRELAAIGCAHDGSESAQRALDAASRLAADVGMRLKVIRVFEPLAFDVAPSGVAAGGVTSYNDTLKEHAAAELEEALSKVEAALQVEGQITVGDPLTILAEESERLDLLLVGSRGYGPLHAVIVGGVSGRLVREAACPVIVFPRSAGHTERDLLFAKAATLER